MENKTPTGYVKWIAIAGGNTEKVLHIKLGEGDQYKPYTVFPGLMQPNFRVPSLNPHEKPIPSSKGFATAQLLLKRGFVKWKRQMFWGRRDRISQQNPVGRTLRGFVLRWIGLGAIASSSLVFDRFFQLI